MTTTVSDRFRIRRGTAADLATVNEVPLADEIVYESDQGTTDGRYKIKIGDGTRNYNDLPYLASSLPTDYISGLRLSYVDATHVQVGTGSAVIQSSGSLLEVATAISVAVTGTSQFLHLYLYDNAGTTAVEASTTAPATAYFGTARSKTSDTTRRYVGSVLMNASGDVVKFKHAPADTIWYEQAVSSAPLLALSGGTSTTATSVSCSGMVPPTANVAHLYAANTSTTAPARLSNADGPTVPTGFLANLAAGMAFMLDMPLSAQAFTYAFNGSPSGGIAFICVAGYRFQR